MQEIKQVLEDWDYDRALVCFRKIGGNSFLLQLFEQGPDPYNQSKLRDELEKYLQANPTAPAPVVTAAAASVTPATSYHNYPLAVQACISLRLSKFKSAQLLHSELEQMPDLDRQSACLEILALMDEVEDLWEQLHHYEAHGELPPAKPEVTVQPATDAQLLKRRNTLRTYISKARGGSKNPKHIPKWEAEIEEIEKILETCED